MPAAESIARSAAKAHIALIRHQKGLSEDSPPGHNVSDLESALTTLSEQLYQSSTRFLLELLQNADDNYYDSKVVPSVHFTYSNDFLRVDCSEVGFSARNVEAICRVGQSTKKNEVTARKYVGEKGIGFKSVFKAADIVWIYSKEYSFKFDKSKPLGIIAPIWNEFPAPIKPGFTSFYLQLSKTYDRCGLLKELRSLDSRLLIFLRRLRKITVSITEWGSKTWERSFSRSDPNKDLVRLVENKKACDFIVTRHQVSSMPSDPKRQGISSTEIILGFPITENHEPRRDSQFAYAFLPIRDYGFEFLIQADFLLIASREDIDESSEWNRALRTALSTAFVDSMKAFNQDRLRYLWPRYLPTREPLQSFLKPFHLDLIKQLKSQPILSSRSGDLASPDCVLYVPTKFTFKGVPLTCTAWNSRRYLSESYAESDMEYLKVLGVKEMGDQSFLDELKLMLQHAKGDFIAKPNSWHSHLASILVGLIHYVSPSLELIPLNDHKKSWVAADAGQILFPAQTTEFQLPGGLDILIVESCAANDPERRKLFKLLGVGDLQQETVIKHIANLHVYNSVSVSSIDLISQIKCLYTAGYKNTEFKRFWFYSDSGQRSHGCELYQDSSKPNSATKFFGAHRKKFIHKDYMKDIGKNQRSWSAWLEDKMDVATIPRLVKSTADGGFELSDDFEWIIKNFPSSDVLLLLRDNWREYSKFFSKKRRDDCSKDDRVLKYDTLTYNLCALQLRERLGFMTVTCMSGKTHQLKSTFLPSQELLAASQDDMPFLLLPDPDDDRWQLLEILGVSIKIDVSLYLRCLEMLSSSKSNDSARVARLFDSIQRRCDDKDEASITKKFFDNKPFVVYIPASAKRQQDQYKWISTFKCRWNGPSGLRRFSSLKGIYPGNKRLFCEILGVQDADINDLVRETAFFQIGDSLSHITKILHTMEKMLENEDSPLIHIPNDCKLPVSKTWMKETDKVSGLESLSGSSEWFIADTAPLQTTFAGIIPLLDIQVDDLAAMRKILVKLGLQSRFLSKSVSSVPTTRGHLEFNQEFTDSYKRKVDFIIRLIPTSKEHRKRREIVIEQLRNLQVYTADEVISQMCVQYKGNRVKGPPGNGSVALVAEKNVLKIYLAAKGGFGEEPTPMELVDEIFNFCGMLPHEPKHSEMCLHIALSQSNLARISKVFTDKGIPGLEGLKFADVYEDESEDEIVSDPKVQHAKDHSGSGSKGDKKKSGLPRYSSVAKVTIAVLGFPIIGLGALLQKSFHHKNNGVDAQPSLGSRPKKTEVPTPKTQRKSEAGFPHPSWIRMFASNELLAFRGELAVHNILVETLGHLYNPLHHWTSKYRMKANLPKFHSDDIKAHSTFKFADRNGSFGQLLGRSALLGSDNLPAAKDWLTNPPTYHLDVKSTSGDLHTEFSISPEQFRRARDLSVVRQQMEGEVNSTPSDIYVLVRVYDMDITTEGGQGKGKDQSKVAFVVDPWESCHMGRLVLQPKGKLVAAVRA